MRLRAADAASISSCHSNPPLSYRASPSTRVARTRSGLPPYTTAAAGSSHGRYAEPERVRIARSARLPGTSEPMSASSPRAWAPPSVARWSASEGESASARSLRARAAEIAARSSSNGSCEGTDETPSVPMPTRSPAPRSSASGATPHPSSPFDRGQWTTATSWRASIAISSASTLTQCAATIRGSRRPAAARRRIPLCPSGSTSNGSTGFIGPSPRSSQSSSS